MDVLIGIVIVAVIAILAIRRLKPDLYAEIKEKFSSWL